ncbi:flagellar filament protein [Cereibacter azotoformans]|uniref:flagellin N-terminal helical domain-containing protein n=1 Tax=Cereibacter azotoformans TaxID=43057 RepID=UPI001F22F06F|nr:flagellin [Cereibacter azotoformans]ULB09854.1 flagellar filament protein [Cereibacter azotoformans]
MRSARRSPLPVPRSAGASRIFRSGAKSFRDGSLKGQSAGGRDARSGGSSMTTINTNIGAIAAQANMTKVNDQFNTAMTRLSTGLRINAAKDDAAGMAIGEKMTAQVMGLNQAVRNAQDGKNLVDTTEGAHVEISSMLQRLRELAVQSSNDTNTAADRGSLASEGKQLIAEINRVAESTTFNGMKILDGSFAGKQLQIGADAGQTITINVDSAAATDIGANSVRSTSLIAAGTDSDIADTTDIIITGFAGSEKVTTSAGQSAKSLATEINKLTASTGVEASAVSKASLSGFVTDTSVSFKIGTAGGTDGNSVSIGTVAITDSSDVRALRDAINAVSGQTGVTASMKSGDNGTIILTHASGEDIVLEEAAFTGTGAEFTVTALDADGKETEAATTAVTLDGTAAEATVTGQVELTSTKAFSVYTEDGADDASTHFTDVTKASELESVAAINLTTAEGAGKAIKVIDVALSKISQSRSELGAVSNRLDSTISNLTNISTSVQAAKSQVMDADFAAESTALARGQILSQAATAMLAQANSSKQNVLSLLRG